MEERIRALTIGPPAYAVRKRNIEDAEQRYLGILLTLQKALAANGKSPAEIEQALLAKAQAFDITRLNGWIENHNRYYPIEANLAFSRQGYLVNGRPWFPEEPWTPERFVEKALSLSNRS